MKAARFLFAIPLLAAGAGLAWLGCVLLNAAQRLMRPVATMAPTEHPRTTHSRVAPVVAHYIDDPRASGTVQ